MSSWDSAANTEHKLKIQGSDELRDIWYRIVYDTPHYVQYTLYVYFAGDIVPLKTWSRENTRIDAREMKDSDVYDLFSNQIEKYISKVTTVGLTSKAFDKILVEEGLL